MTKCTVHKLISDVILHAEGQILLVKYKDVALYDGETGWFLPNDGLLEFEHPQDGARRIAKDQLGLAHVELHLTHIESFKGADGTWHLAFHYKAELDKKPDITPGASVRAAVWFGEYGLPDKSEVAHHGWARVIVKAALKQI